MIGIRLKNHIRFTLVRVVVFAFLLALSQPAEGLDPQRPLSQALLRVWQGQQGLPRGAIFALRQTTEGYLWLGTQAGLYRFDGVRFVPWETPRFPVPEQLWIEDLSEDDAGFLWVATDGSGALRIRRDSVEHYGTAEGLPSDHVHCVLVEREGVVWLGTDRGLSRIRGGQVMTDSPNLDGRRIHALAESPDGHIWMAVDDSLLYRWDGSQLEQVALGQTSSRESIQCLCCTPNGTLWIGTSDGLLAHRPQGNRRLTPLDGLPHKLVHALTSDNTGSLWVGTKEGLCRVQGDRVEPFQTRDGLSQSTVLALHSDLEGNLWVGTKNGLNQFVDRRTLFPFTTAEGLPSNQTGPLLQDSAGTIWVGTLDAGLARFDGRRFQTVATLETGLPSPRILALAEDEPGELWIGTDVGLCHWNGTRIDGTWSTSDGLPGEKVLSLQRDSLGQLWIGTTLGLVTFQNGQFQRPAGLQPAEPVHALVELGDGRLITSIGESLYQVQHQTLSRLPESLQFSTPVSALHCDTDQNLWLALPGRGLGLIDGKRKHEFGNRDGLFDDDIYGITSNDKGQLWMGCSRGIFFIQKANLLAFAQGDSPKLLSTPFSPTDALRTIECQEGVQPSVWKTQDGRVWFSTVRGIIVAAAEQVGTPLPPPRVLIEDVRVDGRVVQRSELSQLPPGRRNMEIRFTAPNLAWPSRIRFRYRLQGFDPDWIDSGLRREAYYTNLPPGHYSFQVMATTVNGTTSPVAEPLEIVLRPYFYQTRWFLPVVLIALCTLTWFAYRWRIRQIRSRWQAVLAERNRIARELHDTLIQGFSGVTMQLQALLARLRGASEAERLTEIIHDAAGCLSEARRSVAGLRQPRINDSNLATAIAETARQLTETAEMALDLRLTPPPRRFAPDVEYQLMRITQEAIVNSVKHSGASQITVTLDFTSRALNLSVADDGTGFVPETYLSHPPPGHYGMIGIRERAAQIGATVQWQSELHRGTTVSLSWPHSLETTVPSVSDTIASANV